MQEFRPGKDLTIYGRKYTPKDIVKIDIHVIAWLYNVRCTCTCMYAYQVLYMYMTSHMYIQHTLQYAI
jgi:hypothetical protein